MCINRKLIRERVRTLVRQNELGEALRYLRIFLKKENDNLVDKVSALESRLCDLEEREIYGTIPLSDAITERNRIVKAILTFTSQVCKPEDA